MSTKDLIVMTTAVKFCVSLSEVSTVESLAVFGSAFGDFPFLCRKKLVTFGWLILEYGSWKS